MSKNRQEVYREFRHFDRDLDGIIDKREFADLMRVLGAEMAPDELEVGFGAIDEDGNGSIDFEEFYEWWSDL